MLLLLLSKLFHYSSIAVCPGHYPCCKTMTIDTSIKVYFYISMYLTFILMQDLESDQICYNIENMQKEANCFDKDSDYYIQ